MSIKRLSDEKEEDLRDLWEYCFFSEQMDDSDWKKWFAILDLKSSLGYYVNNELTSTYVIHPYKMFVRGVLMKMGGIAAVATKPHFRRQKQVTALVTESLKIMKENEQVVSVLYPFKFSFYRRYGYENCAELGWVIAPPKNILIPKDFQPLEIKEISHEESFKVIMSIREKIGKKFNLVIFDSPKMWKENHLKKKSKIFIIIENGKNVGYFITNLEKREGPWNVRLNLRDAIVDSEKARLTVFDYIKKHTDQNKDFSFSFMGDERVTDYFDDLWEGGFKYQITGGPMFRVVDIEKAMELLEFKKNLEVSFSIKIDDEFAPWNTEQMNITIKNGKAKVERSNNKTADLITDISVFTQLFTGYRTVYDLIESNKAIVIKEIAEKINLAFPKRYTRLRTFF